MNVRLSRSNEVSIPAPPHACRFGAGGVERRGCGVCGFSCAAGPSAGVVPVAMAGCAVAGASGQGAGLAGGRGRPAAVAVPGAGLGQQHATAAPGVAGLATAAVGPALQLRRLGGQGAAATRGARRGQCGSGQPVGVVGAVPSGVAQRRRGGWLSLGRADQAGVVRCRARLGAGSLVGQSLLRPAQHALTGVLHQIQHIVKALGAAVVGVGHHGVVALQAKLG